MSIFQTRIVVEDREILLLECRHVCDESVAEIRAIIAEEQPEAVCVELDAQRLDWLENREAWESIDLVEVMRNKQMPLLSAHLALRIFQKRLGRFSGHEPGDEMWAAVQAARAIGAQVVLADREMLTTALRAWRKTPFWSRTKLALTLTLGTLQKTRPGTGSDEDDDGQLARDAVATLERRLPQAKRVAVDERDTFMAHTIASVGAKRIVALVGPAHRDGVSQRLQAPLDRQELVKISQVPAKHLVSRVLPWAISMAIVTLFVVGFALGDREKIQDAMLVWGVVNAICAGALTIAAFGHFWTVIAVAIAAPIVSLNPIVGAGMVGAAVQIFVAPPNIREIEKVGDDITRLSGWWKNRLARVVLILVFANVGSTIGTFVALALFPDLF
ncbi:MAG: TraB family protein [Bradymonadaceae bacterium]|nr:TraB family protein [Lujinxingiaceae bacterium]